MEREREVRKLVNVLNRIARAANYTSWANAGSDAASFCVSQYNKVLARLSAMEPAIERLFTPLAEAASPEVTRIAARELAAYFEEEPLERVPYAGRRRGYRRAHIRMDRSACRSHW